MKQFLNGSGEAFRALETGARNNCIVFQNQEMPSGTTPKFMKIGFEVVADDRALLHVDLGAVYSGDNQTIRQWFESGAMEFANFEELRHWIESELKPEYEKVVVNGGIIQSPPVIESLSNFAEVNNAVPPKTTSVKINPKELFGQLSQEVRGQNESLARLSSRISRHLARTNPRRPATVFAVGPTGVGKTQTAETLARVLSRMVPNRQTFHYLRLDMSEYQEKHRISQLLGAPQGYIGYGEGAQLPDALAMYPNCVVLFDEIEKAHPDILKTLMNAMDVGRLSSPHLANGEREIDCRKAVFFFTSNLESSGILRELTTYKDNEQPDSQVVDEVCRRHLRKAGISPEIIGRIGSFLAYRELNQQARIEILALTIFRTASEYGLNISYIAPETLTTILNKTEASHFGVRPDEYLIDEMFGDVFAKTLDEFGSVPLKIRGVDEFYCLPADENDSMN
ncbi:MAG: AAA family ATPase [Pyrinomonadaceae bacterium]